MWDPAWSFLLEIVLIHIKENGVNGIKFRALFIQGLFPFPDKCRDGVEFFPCVAVLSEVSLSEFDKPFYCDFVIYL